VYIHGAGWVFGSVLTHDRLVRELAVGAGAAVVFPVAGDCVGGNMATVITLLSRERGEPDIRLQVLFYPVTDAAFDTESYHQFAEGYHLRRDTMMWCWDQHTRHTGERSEITASPLRASIQQLHGLPPALIVTWSAATLEKEGRRCSLISPGQHAPHRHSSYLGSTQAGMVTQVERGRNMAPLLCLPSYPQLIQRLVPLELFGRIQNNRASIDGYRR
jgi:hypothetical protein